MLVAGLFIWGSGVRGMLVGGGVGTLGLFGYF